MANTTIDTLEIKIAANAQSATDSLKSLTSALKRLSTALTGIGKDGLKVTDHVAKSLNEMNGALNTITTSSIKKIQKLANGLNDYADALKRIKSLQNVSLKQKIQEASPAGAVKDSLATSTGDSAETDLTKIDTNTPIDAEWKQVKEKAKATTHIFGNLVKSIARIALYRAIRSALKAIAEAFDEGLKNAYGFSQQSESFKRLAETMDRIKTITSQMINQIGAFWGEVKQFVLPAVEWLVEKVRWVAERLTELFAALNGETTYLQAKLVAQTWGEATDNVKKYKQQLLGLDELNNLTAEKKSGNDETDYSTLYDIVDVNKKLFDSVSKIKGMINELTIGIGDILFDWDDLTGEDIAKKIIAGIGGLLGMVMGFSFGGVPGAIVGTIAGVTLGAIIAELFFDNGDTTYDKEKLRSILYPVLGAIVGAWIGFKASGLTGALVGMTVGATMGLILSRLSFSQKDGLTYGKGTLREKLFPVLGAIAGAWIGFKISGMTGMLIGMSVGATFGMIISDITFEKSSALVCSKDRLANQIIASALVGIMGAWIGFKVGGPTGALIGMSIGATLGVILGTIAFDQSVGKLSKTTLANQLIASSLVGIMGGLVGFAVGGPAGALIGMTIGVTLTMMIQSIDWKKANGTLVTKTKEKVDEALDKYGDSGTITTPITGVDVTVDPGKMVLEGISDALEDTRSPGEKLDGIWSGIKKVVSDTVEDIGVTVDLIAQNIDDSVIGDIGRWMEETMPVLFKSGGGLVGQGSLFYAGEAGPEFVGSIGGNSAVANTEQMTDAIYKAAYMGMSQALRENGGNGLAGFVPATTDDLFIAMRKKASNYNKMTGNSAFA